MNTENTDFNDEALKLSQEDGFDATLNPGLANVEKEQVLRVEETLTASFSGNGVRERFPILTQAVLSYP